MSGQKRMARRDNNLAPTPRPLTQGLQLVAALISQSRGQKVSQREITGALETALEARQRRIIVSRSQANLVKCSCVRSRQCALVVIGRAS